MRPEEYKMADPPRIDPHEYALDSRYWGESACHLVRYEGRHYVWLAGAGRGGDPPLVYPIPGEELARAFLDDWQAAHLLHTPWDERSETRWARARKSAGRPRGLPAPRRWPDPVARRRPWLRCAGRPWSRCAAATSRGRWVPRMARAQGLIALARGDRAEARRRLSEAAEGWQRHLEHDAGAEFLANFVDLGRPPIVGLVEPEWELRRLTAELAELDAAEVP